MSVRDNLQIWFVETPKHLVAALFALAGAGVVLVLVTLFVVAPRISAIPNEAELPLQPTATARPPQEKRLLVEVTGQTFRTDSTLNMGIAVPPDGSPNGGSPALPGADSAAAPPPNTPDSGGKNSQDSTHVSTPVPVETGGSPDQSDLNLQGVEKLKFPVAVNVAEGGFGGFDEKLPSFSARYGWKKSKSPKDPSFSLRTRQVEAGSYVDFAGVRNFFTDLKNSEFTRMQRDCWTITPEVFTDRYTTRAAQTALLEAFKTTPTATERGLKWHGKYVDLEVTWQELATRYACPSLAYRGKLDAVSAQDVNYLMSRLMARSTTPVNPSDTESLYPLVCPQWNPPPGLTEFSPAAREKIVLDANGRLSATDFKILEAIQNRGIKLYTVKNEYPMYLRASETQLKEPSAYFFRDKFGSLCIGSIVGKS